jgi:LacI family transcriptional regulator
VFAESSRPPLTTVDMCLKELGELAARTLLADIGGRPAHGPSQQPCRLVIRESSGASGPAARHTETPAADPP